MRAFLVKLFAVTLLVSITPVYALFGIGGHGGLDLTSSIDSVYPPEDLTINSLDTVITTANTTVQRVFPSFSVRNFLSDSGVYPSNFERTGITKLYAGGGKIYIDALPFIDLEAALNIIGKDYNFKARFLNPVKMNKVLTEVASGSVSSASELGSELLACRDSIDSPFAYGRIHIDLTIRKSLLKLPPVVNILKFYVGAGPSAYLATPLITPELFNETFNSLDISSITDPTKFGTALVDQLVKEAKKQELKIGGHVMCGITIKPPVIPFAIYADGKFNFGHSVTEGAPSTSFIVYGGAALAF